MTSSEKFQEKELNILRDAVDRVEKQEQSKVVNSPEVKKIILLSFESMTSSWWLKDNFSLDIELPSLANLKSDSIHFPHALAQVDSTRPFIASMLHGLFASQHSFGDYSKKSSYKKWGTRT